MLVRFGLLSASRSRTLVMSRVQGRSRPFAVIVRLIMLVTRVLAMRERCFAFRKIT